MTRWPSGIMGHHQPAWGEDDRVVPPVYAREFADRLQRLKEVVIPRCGHLPMLEKPEELARALLEFFREPT